MKLKIFILLIVIGHLSCTKKATIELPKSEKKLVVTCFISPQYAVIAAVVKSSSPKFGGTGPQFGGKGYEEDIQNATVLLSDGINTIRLPYVQDTTVPCYKLLASKFPIVSGKTYSLFVSTPDGKQVSASTTVPAGILPIAAVDVKVKNSDSTFIEYDYNITVDDLLGQTNYVAVYTKDLYFTKNFASKEDYYYAYGYFDTDEKLEKTQYVYSGSSGVFQQDTIVYAALQIGVLNCSKEFYLYNKSVQDGAGNGGPFSDPVLVYSNVTDGFGCFGSYVINPFVKVIRN